MYRVGLVLSLAVAGILPALAGNPLGIQNFDQVDAHVYRGAQPTGQGLRYLASIGVKTVIDLREPGSRATAEERMATDLGMAYINVPMSGLTPPTEAELLKTPTSIRGRLQRSRLRALFARGRSYRRRHRRLSHRLPSLGQ